MKQLFWIVLACVSCFSLAHAEPEIHSVPVFKSQSVQLPDGDQVFTGRNAEVVNGNCLACHSAEMVMDQPALSQAEWAAEVKKMINIYKAPVSPGDVPLIVAYLVATRGKP